MAQDTDNFVRKVLNKHLIRHIVDDVFLSICLDEGVREDFLDLVENRVYNLGTAGHEMTGDLQDDIKASIKKLLDLDDVRINRHPDSHIIDSYMEHRLKNPRGNVQA